MTTDEARSGADRPRIYLAGPEVFLPDVRGIGARKIEICAHYGLEGVFPCEGELDLEGLEAGEKARRIALVNEALMRSSDAMVANLTPFRGVSMDSGTAFEIGFMRALGRPIAGYTNVPLDYKARAEMLRAAPRLPFDGDGDAVAVEDFELAENLMIDVAISVSTFETVRHAAVTTPLIGDLTAFEAAVARLARLIAEAPMTTGDEDDDDDDDDFT